VLPVFQPVRPGGVPGLSVLVEKDATHVATVCKIQKEQWQQALKHVDVRVVEGASM
jgi:hypothetical protein